MNNTAGCTAGVAGGAGMGALAGSRLGPLGAAAGAVAGGALAYGSMSGPGGACGSSGKSRVICTHFFSKGMMEKALWRADLEFTFKNLSSKTVRGYQFWAIPYVRLMRKSQLAEKIIYPIAKWRAQELAYQMGVLPSGSIKGKIVRLIVEPICFAIGNFVGQQDWESLWNDPPTKTGQVA